MVGPEVVQVTIDKIQIVKGRLKATRDTQKNYTNCRWRDLQFADGDYVFLKILPWKGVLRFRK